MSRMTDVKVSVTIDGDDRDVFVRGYVTVEPGLGMGGNWGAEIDGDVQLRLGGDWWPVESVNLDKGDLEHIEASLCEAALEDDSDQRCEYPDDDRELVDTYAGADWE